MTRQEVYDLCVDRMTGYENTVRVLLPKEAIDAIIDCAKEETIERLRNNVWEYTKGRAAEAWNRRADNG